MASFLKIQAQITSETEHKITQFLTIAWLGVKMDPNLVSSNNFNILNAQNIKGNIF